MDGERANYPTDNVLCDRMADEMAEDFAVSPGDICVQVRRDPSGCLWVIFTDKELNELTRPLHIYEDNLEAYDYEEGE